MPYIDPITGAYVENGLDALPPGYNQPKAGNEANIAQMRAQLNSEEALRQHQVAEQTKSKYLSDPTGLARFAMERMPGAGVAQAPIAALSDMLGSTIGNLYGVGKQALSGQLGNLQAGNQAYEDAQRLAQKFHYEPSTQVGKDIYNTYNKIGEVTGPLPELFSLQRGKGFTPDDLRVAGKMATEDFRNFGMDYQNAKAGVQREYPTAGSRAAQFTDVAGDVARPFAEKAYDMYMNPDSGVETRGIRPLSTLDGLVAGNQPMYAVKPGGGNFPTNMGSTKPLSEQRNLGRHLSDVQIDDPIKAFVKQFENYSLDSTTNWKLKKAWEKYLEDYLPARVDRNDGQGVVEYGNPDNLSIEQFTKNLAEKFVADYNANAQIAGQKPIYSPTQFEEVAPYWNTWVMSPYQKYIANQMGTGIPTDTVLKTMDEANVPILNTTNERGRVIKGLLPNLKPPSAYEQEDVLGKRGTAARKYMLSGIDIDAPQYANIGNETATTPGGKAMEAAIDRSFDQTGFYSPKDYPQAPNLSKNAVINDVEFNGPYEGTGLSAIRQRVLQDMLAGKILPKDIPKALPANILRKIIDDYVAEQKGAAAVQAAKDDWRAARFENIQSVIPYDDKSKMHVITPADVQTDAGKNLAMRDLGQSTIDLRQCIGAGCRNTADYPTPEYNHGPYIEPHTGKVTKGAEPYEQTHIKRYMDRLEKGKAEIARLLDPDGVAQASVDLHYESPRVLRISQQKEVADKWLENHDPQALIEFEQNFADFGITQALKNAYQLYPELYEYINKLNTKPTKYISEMKGYDNQEVKEKYVPHMVDWLNSMGDKLTDVRDLKNLPSVHDLDRHYDAIGKLLDDRKHWYSPTVEEFFKKADDGRLLPRFFTTDQFAQLATDMGVDLSAEPVKAEGEKTKYPPNASLFMMDMIDYYEPGAIRKSYGGHDRIISYNPQTGEVVASEVKRDENGNWIDHPTYGGPRSHNTVPSPEEFRRDMGRPMRLTMRELGIEDQFANAVQAMEPEAPQQFNRPTEFQRGIVGQNMEDYLQGHFANIENVIADMEEPYATDMRILVGNQTNPDARLSDDVHRRIVDVLLDQDNRTPVIRHAIDNLQRGNHHMPEAQAENLLNILISWTERYPLNE
jgi:hypothetical protein